MQRNDTDVLLEEIMKLRCQVGEVMMNTMAFYYRPDDNVARGELVKGEEPRTWLIHPLDLADTVSPMNWRLAIDIRAEYHQRELRKHYEAARRTLECQYKLYRLKTAFFDEKMKELCDRFPPGWTVTERRRRT